MDHSNGEEDTSLLLEKRQQLTQALYDLPYDLILYLERAVVYGDLGYPDLAAGDAYRALLLTDEVSDESFEYHDQALDALRQYTAAAEPEVLCGRQMTPTPSKVSQEVGETGLEEEESTLLQLSKKGSRRAYQILSISLLLCGCLKSAYEFCARGLAAFPGDEELLQSQEYIQKLARRRLKVDKIDINDLPDQGLVRREIYPWNDHEPNRFSQETLDFLNAQLESVAPNCVVRVTELPTLLENASETDDYGIIPTNKQLGLFAKSDIAPGEMLLDEFSVLTANNRLKDALCDACSSELPTLEAEQQGIPCDDCNDAMFCSQLCYDTAMESYHPAVCDKEIDTVAKDPADPKETPNALYLLLLARTLALSATQEVHPLDLPALKFIWGDFLPSHHNAVPLSPTAGPPPIWTLPFSFAPNVSGPLHILEKMDIDIFAELRHYDLWILNTLYSKFRGTASARVSTRDGRPEVAAVHPLWCLANHSCDPNVQWEWGGHMKFFAREKRIDETRHQAGLKAGEEILSHYCDIELPVKERREWAQGSLGGWCMCERCRREAALENGVENGELK